ncbi:MAG TPA: amino acid dehydrogenase [Actinomycetota bacterium]
MTVFDRLQGGYEQVVYGHDAPSGLRAIIAIYSTALGPALGGTRILPYPSEDDALADALRLGRAMAFKAACAGLALGGGKAVIIGDPAEVKTRELLHAFGRLVDRLGGAYITSADVGSTVQDLDVIAEVTPYVSGSSKGSGDPSPMTGYGVFRGMAAVCERVFGEPSVAGRHVVVSGVGKVGSHLARLLAEAGAQLTLSDVREDVVTALAAEIGAEIVAPEQAAGTPCDVFAPCALGGVVNDRTLGSFKCRAIAGGANNQLETPALGHALHDAGILYAPDFVINAGGLINVEDELHGYDPARARAKAERIADTLREIFAMAAAEGMTPSEAADRIAESRIAAAGA